MSDGLKFSITPDQAGFKEVQEALSRVMGQVRQLEGALKQVPSVAKEAATAIEQQAGSEEKAGKAAQQRLKWARELTKEQIRQKQVLEAEARQAKELSKEWDKGVVSISRSALAAEGLLQTVNKLTSSELKALAVLKDQRKVKEQIAALEAQTSRSPEQTKELAKLKELARIQAWYASTLAKQQVPVEALRPGIALEEQRKKAIQDMRREERARLTVVSEEERARRYLVELNRQEAAAKRQQEQLNYKLITQAEMLTVEERARVAALKKINAAQERAARLQAQTLTHKVLQELPRGQRAATIKSLWQEREEQLGKEAARMAKQRAAEEARVTRELQKQQDPLARISQEIAGINIQEQARLQAARELLAALRQQVAVEAKSAAARSAALRSLDRATRAKAIKALMATRDVQDPVKPPTVSNEAWGRLKQVAPTLASIKSRIRGLTSLLTHHADAWSVVGGTVRGVSGALGKLWLTYGALIPMMSAFAATAAVKTEISSGLDVSREFAMIKAISPEATVTSLREMRRELQQLAQERQSIFTVTEMAQGLEKLTRAGFAARDAMQALPSVLNLALIGEMSLGDAATLAQAAMHAFNLSIKDMPHIVDSITYSANEAATNVSELAAALTNAASVGELYGVKLDEVNAMLQVLAKYHIVGSKAGTYLLNMFKSLADGGSKVEYTLRTLGVNLRDSTGEFRQWSDILSEINSKLQQFDAASRSKVIQGLFPNIRGKKAGAIIVPNFKEVIEKQKELENLTNYSQTAVESLRADIGYAGAVIKSQFSGVLDSIFLEAEGSIWRFFNSISGFLASPEFRQSLLGITKLFMSLSETIISSIPGMIKLGVTLGGMYAGFKAMSILTGITEMFVVFRTEVTKLGGVLASLNLLLTGSAAALSAWQPILMLVGAIGGAALAYYTITDAMQNAASAAEREAAAINSSMEAYKKKQLAMELGKRGYEEPKPPVKPVPPLKYSRIMGGSMVASIHDIEQELPLDSEEMARYLEDLARYKRQKAEYDRAVAAIRGAMFAELPVTSQDGTLTYMPPELGKQLQPKMLEAAYLQNKRGNEAEKKFLLSMFRDFWVSKMEPVEDWAATIEEAVSKYILRPGQHTTLLGKEYSYDDIVRVLRKEYEKSQVKGQRGKYKLDEALLPSQSALKARLDEIGFGRQMLQYEPLTKQAKVERQGQLMLEQLKAQRDALQEKARIAKEALAETDDATQQERLKKQIAEATAGVERYNKKIQQQIELNNAAFAKQAGVWGLTVRSWRMDNRQLQEQLELKKKLLTASDTEVGFATRRQTILQNKEKQLLEAVKQYKGEELAVRKAAIEESTRLALQGLEQERAAMADWKSGAIKGLNNYAAAAQDAFSQFRDFGTNTFKQMEDAIVQFTMTGKASFRDMANSIISDLVRITVRKQVLGPLAKGAGELLSTLFSGGDTGYTGDIVVPSWISEISHSGGVIGRDLLPTRSVPAMLFAGAPRLHFGLAPDEFPAILQRGEEVIPRDRRGTPAPVIKVNVVNNASGSVEATVRTANGGRDLDIVIDEVIGNKLASRRGKTYQALRSLVG